MVHFIPFTPLSQVKLVRLGQASTYLSNVFFDLPRLIYYLLINFFNYNLENDFNLGIKLTQSNGPLSTSEIVNHFVNHFTSQNDKVQLVKKATNQNGQCQNQLVPNDSLIKLTNVTFGPFFTNFPTKKDHDLQQ